MEYLDFLRSKIKPFRAIKLGRRGKATELNPESFRDGLFYLRKAEIEAKTPTLFDAL